MKELEDWLKENGIIKSEEKIEILNEERKIKYNEWLERLRSDWNE